MSSNHLPDLVMWRDATLAAINKPAGLPTLPDGYDPQAPFLKKVLEPLLGPLWIVHRLDRDTSGVMVVALTAGAHRQLNTQFERRNVEKIYHALVRGSPEWEQKTVSLRLRVDGDRRHRTIVDSRRGKPAETDLHVLERLGAYCLLEATPRTGRTHQIRAHLATLGLPLLGDSLYGSLAALPQPVSHLDYPPEGSDPQAHLGRVALHAQTLSLNHPLSAERLTFSAPYPQDFSHALEHLRQMVDL